MVDAAVSLLSALPHHLYYPHRRHKLGHDGNDLNYTKTLANTKFVLCPPGNSVDTFRLMEAMDAGAIPIVNSATLAYYRLLLPSAITRHWVEMGNGVSSSRNSTIEGLSTLMRLVEDVGSLRVRQRAMLTAYESHEEEWTNRVAERLESPPAVPLPMSRSSFFNPMRGRLHFRELPF